MPARLDSGRPAVSSKGPSAVSRHDFSEQTIQVENYWDPPLRMTKGPFHTLDRTRFLRLANLQRGFREPVKPGRGLVHAVWVIRLGHDPRRANFTALRVPRPSHLNRGKTMNEPTEPIRTEIRDGIAWATIDCPPMNLLGGALFGALGGLVDQMEKDETTRVLVLRSADPDFFIAHGDVEAIARVPSNPTPEATELPFTHQILERLRRLRQITIAQVEGYARGGGSEVTLACDMRFAAKGKAVFGQPEVPLGILPGAGGTVRLTRMLAPLRSFSGATISVPRKRSATAGSTGRFRRLNSGPSSSDWHDE